MTDGPLERYIAAVEKVRSARADVLDAATRQKIAEELGISPEDLAAATAAGEAALVRAAGLLSRGTWDEALRNLAEADALLPDDARVAYGLGRAHLGLRQRGRALAACRRCLEIDPRHGGALALLGELQARPRRRRRRVMLVAVLALAGGAVGVVVSMSGGPRSLRCPDGSPTCTIGATVAVEDLGDGVELAPATFEITPSGLRLNLSGRLTHRGITELGLLRLGVRLLGQGGGEVGRLSVDAQPEFAPPMRPGDTRTFFLSEIVPPGTRRVAVIPGARKTEPAAASYGQGQPVVVEFAAAPPTPVALAAAYRTRSRRSDDGKTTVEGVVELVNRGAGVIRELEVAAQGLGADGGSVGDARRETIVYPIMPAMQVGERRTMKVFLHVSGLVVSEKLLVTKVE